MQGSEVAPHERRYVSVHDRRRRAFVLPVLGQEFAGERDRVACLAQRLADAAFVPGIRVAVQETDGHRAHVPKFLGQVRNLRLGQRLQHRSVMQCPFRDPVFLALRDQPASRRRRPVVQFRTVLAGQFEQVFEPASRDEGRSGTGSLQQGVGRDRRTVDHLGGRERCDAIENRSCRVVRCRPDLQAVQASAVPSGEVRERAAAVNSDPRIAEFRAPGVIPAGSIVQFTDSRRVTVPPMGAAAGTVRGLIARFSDQALQSCCVDIGKTAKCTGTICLAGVGQASPAAPPARQDPALGRA